MLIATVVGVMLGIESGYRRGERIDRGLLAGLMLLGGLPDFFLGIVLLLIFGVSLNLFPLSGALTPTPAWKASLWSQISQGISPCPWPLWF